MRKVEAGLGFLAYLASGYIFLGELTSYKYGVSFPQLVALYLTSLFLIFDGLRRMKVGSAVLGIVAAIVVLMLVGSLWILMIAAIAGGD